MRCMLKTLFTSVVLFVITSFLVATPIKAVDNYEYSKHIWSTTKINGYVVESKAGSRIGGTSNMTDLYLKVGDDSQNREYVSILDFDTSGLPDNVRFFKEGVLVIPRKSIYPNVLGNISVDVKKGFFGKLPTVEADDFQAPATVYNLSELKVFDVYRHLLIGTEFTQIQLSKDIINTTGHTQFRLHMKIPTNMNNTEDLVSLYGGEDVFNSTHTPYLGLWYYK